jgi:hypothetical protein
MLGSKAAGQDRGRAKFTMRPFDPSLDGGAGPLIRSESSQKEGLLVKVENRPVSRPGRTMRRSSLSASLIPVNPRQPSCPPPHQMTGSLDALPMGISSPRIRSPRSERNSPRLDDPPTPLEWVTAPRRYVEVPTTFSIDSSLPVNLDFLTRFWAEIVPEGYIRPIRVDEAPKALKNMPEPTGLISRDRNPNADKIVKDLAENFDLFLKRNGESDDSDSDSDSNTARNKGTPQLILDHSDLTNRDDAMLREDKIRFICRTGKHSAKDSYAIIVLNCGLTFVSPCSKRWLKKAVDKREFPKARWLIQKNNAPDEFLQLISLKNGCTLVMLAWGPILLHPAPVDAPASHADAMQVEYLPWAGPYPQRGWASQPEEEGGVDTLQFECEGTESLRITYYKAEEAGKIEFFLVTRGFQNGEGARSTQVLIPEYS